MSYLAVAVIGIIFAHCTKERNVSKMPDSKLPSNSQPSGLSQKEATDIAKRKLHELGDKHDWVLLEKKTLEKEFGWIFFYDSKTHMDTGNSDDKVPGTAPFIVERKAGKVFMLPSSMPPAAAIRSFEKKWEEKFGGSH